MSLRPLTGLSIAALVALAACSTERVNSPGVTLDPGASPSASEASGQSMRLIHAKVCPSAAPGEARCHSLVRVDDSGQPLSSRGPSGYTPANLRLAYGLPTIGGTGQTIAIVDAFDDPNAESDLAAYRAQFSIKACTTASGCFRKVSQTGGSNYPRSDAGWAEEISLDLDMASAICPNCNILLVEASSNSFADLSAAVDEAAALGANAISNSYGGGEYSGEVSDQSHYNHPHIAITASSGDAGYGVEFPAASQYVTAVGGTSLSISGSVANETAWSDAGSGCSAFIAKPSWQKDTGCANRTVADVSAVADPNTGVAVYDTFRLHPGGWLVFGGTSVASPIIASVYALAGNASATIAGSSSYSNLTSMFDVLSGSNGKCGGSYLCTAGTHFDGPTGNGTPRGLGGF